MEILNAVAHKVNKDRGVKGASLGEAKGELARTDELNSLMLTLRQLQQSQLQICRII